MPGQTLGGVGCHLYQEFEGHCLTASQLEQAITTLLQRHPMLHIAFRPDGQQVWLPHLTGTASPFAIYAITTLKAARPIWTHCASA